MARRLVADGGTSFLRVLTDPRDGAPLEIGRTSYRLTKADAPMAATPRRQVHLPQLQQPLPGQRRRPHPRLGRGRRHRRRQPRPNLPQTPPAQTQHAWRPVGATRESPPGWISPKGRSYPANIRTGNHLAGQNHRPARTGGNCHSAKTGPCHRTGPTHRTLPTNLPMLGARWISTALPHGCQRIRGPTGHP